MPILTTYGWQGVNVTKNPIQLEDNELTKAQNAFRDAAGEHGALRKRPGLTKINATALSGDIYGFVNVPFAGFGGDPIFYIAVDNQIAQAYNWITSDDSFATYETATEPAETSGDKDGARDGGANTHYISGSLAQIEDMLVYPGFDSSPGTLRVWDGITDRELIKIPPNPFTEPQALGSFSGVIGVMLMDGPHLYFHSADGHGLGESSGLLNGRIFRYDFSTGALLQIGQGYGQDSGLLTGTGQAGAMPLSLAMHQGSLFMSLSPISTGSGERENVYYIRPGVDSTWTFDTGLPNNSNESVSSLASYKGLLYVGTTQLSGTVRASSLYVRSAAGVYTASTTTGAGLATANGFPALKVFGDNLYASVVDQNVDPLLNSSYIKKFDGTTWSTVLTMESGVAGLRRGIAMVVQDGRLYVLATDNGTDAHVYHTANGTSWTDLALPGETRLTSLFGVF